MKRWIGLLGRGLGLAGFAAACALALASLLLLAAEQSGWLADWARAEVRASLRASGAEFRLASLELDWFTPAVRVEGLELGAGGRQAVVQRAVIVLAPFAPAARRIRSVLVQGGRVRLSPELLETLAAVGAPHSAAAPAAQAPVLESVRRLPPIELRGVRFDVVHPQWGDIPLGKVDATFALDAQGRAELTGVLSPSLAPAGNSAAQVVLHGRVERPSVLSLELSTRALPLSVAALPEGTQLDGLRAFQPAGDLALAARAELSLDPSQASSLELRAQLANASLTRAATGLALREGTVDVQARCRPAPGSDWFDPSGWSALALASGRWKEAELSASARYGLAAGAGRVLSAELRVEACEVSRRSLEELGLWSHVADSFIAISPEGKADLCAGIVQDGAGGWSGAVDVLLGGELQATYEGWRVADGTREGFPLTVGHLHGRVTAAFDPRRARSFQVGLHALTGQPVDEPDREVRARVDGVIAAALPDAFNPELPEVLLDFQGSALSPGPAVRKAVEGLSGTKWIWPAFRPSQGRVRGSGRLMSDPRTGGLAGGFEVFVEDVQLAWEGLPVAIEHAVGRIGLHFDPRTIFGVTFDLTGKTATSDSVVVRGRVQQDPALAPPPRVRGVRRTVDPQDERDLLMDFDVGVREISLRGSDRDVIARTWTGVGQALDMFQPLGKADVGVRATRARPRDPFALRVEIEPRGAQITPTSFSTPTSDLLGRVIVQGVVSEKDVQQAFTTRIAPLVGAWTQGARVGCEAVFPSAGEDHLVLRGAGIDITNRALVGAFREAFAGGPDSPGFDLGALSIDGRIDFAADVHIATPPGGAPRTEGVYRVFLRDNAFRTEVAAPAGRREGPGFGLSGLWGELVQEKDELTGERIEAQLGKTAVSLEDARFFDEGGTVRFTTSVQARGIPLDREHLGLFLDPDTVNAAIDRLHLTGLIDFERVTLEYVGKSERGGPKLSLRGEVRPREAFVDLGLPLAIERARVELSELVLEGGHVRAWARVAGLVGSIAGRKLQGARMLVTYVEPRLSLIDLDGALEGGRITDLSQVGGPGGRARTSASGPAFTMDLLDPYRFELGLALRDVELKGLMRGMFQTEFADTGFIDSEIRLQGSLEKLTGIAGDGWVALRETRLWSVPVMRDLLSQLGLDSSVVFKSMKSRFALEDGVIRMDAMHVESPLLQLVGEGTLDLDGRLKHDLQVRFGDVDNLGPISRLWYWIQNSLLSISVRGDMSRPKVILKGALSFFQSSGSGKRDLPLPSLAPLPDRF